MATYRNRATLVADGSFTYWNASDLDTDMSEHPGSPDPADYTDFVIMFEMAGASLPTSSSGNFDFLVPDGSGGWKAANRKIGYTDYDADEWTVVESIDGTSESVVSQAGNTLTLTIHSPTSATVQSLQIYKIMEVPSFALLWHTALNSSSANWACYVSPESSDARTREVLYFAGSNINVATKRNGSESYPTLVSGPDRTVGFWTVFFKGADSMGFKATGQVAASPVLTPETFSASNYYTSNYHPAAYPIRAGSTGQTDAISQRMVVKLILNTPAATGTYTATFSYLEQYVL